MWKIVLVVMWLLFVIGIMGCESKAQTGALLGSGAGALVGQAIGGDTKSTLIGAAVGGGAGYIIGSEKDKQKTKAEMESIRQEMNVVTVNVVNSNGSVSQVRLAKEGIGYRGPRGEFYDHLPTAEELGLVYGF